MWSYLTYNYAIFYGKLFFARTEKTKILYVELLPRYQSWYSKLHVWILGTHKIHHFILKSMILTNTVWIYLIVFVLLNSSPPSAPYMRQWIGSTFVQIMACRLFGWVIANWTIGNKLQLNFYQNTKLLVHENASEKNRLWNGSQFVQGRLVNKGLVTYPNTSQLTHSGLVTPYGDRDLG